MCATQKTKGRREALTLLSLILDSIWGFCNMQSSTEEGEGDLRFHRLVYCTFTCLKSGGTFRHCLLGVDVSLLLDSHPLSLKQVFAQLEELGLVSDGPGSHPGFAPHELGNFRQL